jgi:ABC-type nickel/cobalt efflux system permease component RcnA
MSKKKQNIESNTTTTNTNKIKEEKTFLDRLGEQLDIYKEKIETLLKDIKENNSIVSYIWLLLFSFLYGTLHALGPGHGKSLVGAYFLSENRSVSKAAFISTMIGVVHTFSAFIMTLVVYYLFSVLFSNFFLDVEQVTAKISAIIIITIAIYMIYKKIKQNKKHEHGNHSCGCGGCQSKATDFGVILSAGIVPCPGTVTIFLFTFGLGIVFVGFLSAIAMSIGMSLVIFITAYLSSKVRKSSESNSGLVKFFEYGSLVFILILGFVLLFV